MSRKLLAIIIFAIALIALALLLLIGSGSSSSSATVDLSRCQQELSVNQAINCIADATSDKLDRPGASPVSLMPALDRQVEKSDQETVQFCHSAMHTVGRRFAKQNNVTLANLQNYLPRSDSFNCAAGFAHGMVSVIGVNPNNANQLIQVCAREPTRVRQVACTHGIGHAFRRSFNGLNGIKQTIAACKRLGFPVAIDCAQGAYHDYIFAFEGIDGTTKPANLNQIEQICRNKPRDYISACWYRLFTYYPKQLNVGSPERLQQFCRRQDSARQCFSAGVAAFTIPPVMVESCRRFKGQTAADCFAAIELKGPGLKAIQINDKKGQERTIVRRQRDLAFLMKRCLLMPDKRGERACVYWLSYYAVAEQSALLSARQALNTCRLVNREFVVDCRRAVSYARSYYLRQT